MKTKKVQATTLPTVGGHLSASGVAPGFLPGLSFTPHPSDTLHSIGDWLGLGNDNSLIRVTGDEHPYPDKRRRPVFGLRLGEDPQLARLPGPGGVTAIRDIY